ncbi:MAG: PQQ-binding-like beta-propeller repeat protein [Verrucomicrobiae bacterium]|nr:PQQ-binding-like beta-propeller repeat protein [Verrucomicrobiae bacterium]
MRNAFILAFVLPTLAAATTLAGPSRDPTEVWPQFRGPNGAGLSSSKNVPATWSRAENVLWRAELGSGHSSPVIWGDWILLTVFKGAALPLATQPRSLRERLLGGVPQRGELWTVCLNRADGKVLWEKKCPASAIETVHQTSNPAASSPVTDGEHVWVYFGSYGVLCYDLAGNLAWEKPLGPFENKWGASGSSPVLYGGSLILNLNNDDQAFVLALDKRTGRQKWKTNRPPQRTYATPMLWDVGGQRHLIINGAEHVVAYDPDTGRELWRCGGMTKFVNPTPVAGHGLLFVAANGPGGSVVMAIKPGGRGDITGSHVAWRNFGQAPYVPSPLLVGDYLFVVKNGGMATCFEARTGKVMWKELLPAKGNYYASPVHADGKIYVANEKDGAFTVFAASPAFKVLGTPVMGERTMATPAIVDGRIYLRTEKALYCVGTK